MRDQLPRQRQRREHGDDRDDHHDEPRLEARNVCAETVVPARFFGRHEISPTRATGGACQSLGWEFERDRTLGRAGYDWRRGGAVASYGIVRRSARTRGVWRRIRRSALARVARASRRRTTSANEPPSPACARPARRGGSARALKVPALPIRDGESAAMSSAEAVASAGSRGLPRRARLCP